MLTSELGAPRPLLIDTHIWVWASGNAGGLSRFASWVAPEIEKAAIERRLFACTCSVWEIALKAQRGDLIVSGDLRQWVREQKAYPGVQLIPLTSGIMIESVALPAWIRRSDGKEHRDPNDRFLAAAARRKSAVLITCDTLILHYAEEGNLLACDASA